MQSVRPIFILNFNLEYDNDRAFTNGEPVKNLSKRTVGSGASLSIDTSISNINYVSETSSKLHV